MSKLPRDIEDFYMTTEVAAEVVGVNRQRIAELISNERICEVWKTDLGWKTEPVKKVFGAWRIPRGFRILRANRERRGPVMDYIEAWEAAHPEVLEHENLR